MKTTTRAFGVPGAFMARTATSYFNYIGLDTVQEILNGTFKKTCWQHGFMLTTLWQDYPQLAEETRKRAHRKAYRAKLEAKRSALRAKGVLGKGDTR